MGVELDSQSFEFNDSDENSAGFKSRNQKAKEYDNRVSKNVKMNEHDFDSLPNDMKSANCIPEPKLEFYNSDIDLKNHHEPKPEFYDGMVDFKSDYETQVMDSHEPESHSSEDIGSFMMFANDEHSVKKSIASPISDPLQVDKFQNSVDVFMDRTITECEPELEVCYKESSYHDVKDICVDKGVFTKHKFMFEESVDGKAYNFFPVESFDDNQKPKDNTGIKVLDLPETEESDQVSLNHDQHNDVMHKVDGEIEDVIDNVTKVMDLHEDIHDSMPT
ncbi:hypothetical protein A2U01_0019391, partial [Trifolium medium]|nr:hypothetical protein [Trifolium medium]